MTKRHTLTALVAAAALSVPLLACQAKDGATAAPATTSPAEATTAAPVTTEAPTTTAAPTTLPPTTAPVQVSSTRTDDTVPPDTVLKAYYKHVKGWDDAKVQAAIGVAHYACELMDDGDSAAYVVFVALAAARQTGVSEDDLAEMLAGTSQLCPAHYDSLVAAVSTE